MKIAGKNFSCLQGLAVSHSQEKQNEEEKVKIDANHYLYKKVNGEFPCSQCGTEMVWPGRADQPEEKVDVYSHGDAEFRCSCGSIERRNVWRRIEVEGIHYKVVSCSGCGRKGNASVRSSGPHYCGACAMKDYLSNPKY